MKYLTALIIAAGLSRAALADEVKLTDGRALEGIARKEPGRVVVETGRGTMTVPADEVGSIVPGRTPLHEYAERVLALGMHPTASQVFETAQWAQDHKLIRYVNPLLQWTIALDPDHAQARGLLDYVNCGGCWIPRSEGREMQERKDKYAAPKPTAVKKARPQPEVSPGYVYFGIPPMAPPRGSQRHGGDYGSMFSFAYPVGAAAYGGRAMVETGTTVTK